MVIYETISFFDFQKKYHSDEQCRDKLFKMRWPDGYICPHCGNKTYTFHSTRILYQCKTCKYQASATSGTIMHKTRVSLVKWFWMIYFVSSDKRGISTLEVSKKLELRYATAWAMMHKIRKGMSDRDSKYNLHGVIEMDETFIGSPSKGNEKKGRGSEKIPVVISVATKDEKMLFAKMHIVESVSKEEIEKIVTQTVAKHETIKTDGLQVYKFLKTIGYEHNREVISGSGMKAHDLLKWVHIIAGNVKAWLNGTFHGIDKKHLQLYLDEFCYRLNRRFFENQLFDRLLNACILSKGFTYEELIG